MRHLVIGCLSAAIGLGCGVSSSAVMQTTDDITAPKQVRVSGFSCDNGYGADLNQAYVYQGTTQDGRPYYRGTVRTDRYLYFDERCSDDTPTPRWLLGGEPDPARTSALHSRDNGCDNDFSIATESRELPTGTLEAAWLWCGDQGHRDRTVTIASD